MARITISTDTTFTINSQADADALNADGYHVDTARFNLVVNANVNYGGDFTIASDLTKRLRKFGPGNINYTGTISDRTTIPATRQFNLATVEIHAGSIDSHMIQNAHLTDFDLHGGILRIRAADSLGSLFFGAPNPDAGLGGNVLITGTGTNTLIVNANTSPSRAFNGNIFIDRTLTTCNFRLHGNRRWDFGGHFEVMDPDSTTLNVIVRDTAQFRFLGSNETLDNFEITANAVGQVDRGSLTMNQPIAGTGLMNVFAGSTLKFNFNTDYTMPTARIVGQGGFTLCGTGTTTINDEWGTEGTTSVATITLTDGGNLNIAGSGIVRQVNISETGGTVSGTGNITRHIIANGGIVEGTLTLGLDLRLLEGSTYAVAFNPSTTNQMTVNRNIIIDKAILNLRPNMGTYPDTYSSTPLFSAPNSDIPTGTFDRVTIDNEANLGTTRLKHIYRYSDGEILIQASDVGSNMLLDGSVHDGDTLPANWVFDYDRSTTNANYFRVRDTNADGDQYDNNSRKSFAIQAHPDNENSVLIEWSGFGITLVPGHTYILVHDEGREVDFGAVNTYTVRQSNGSRNRIRDARISYQ